MADADVVLAYRDARSRITALLATRPHAGGVDVPHTPGWTVHDVVAHLCGVVDDALHGRMDGMATPTWTDAQVRRGRTRPLAELLEQWEHHAPPFEAALALPGVPGSEAVYDIVTHEHDLCHAFGVRGRRHSSAIGLAVAFLSSAARTRCVQHGVTPLQVIADGIPLTTNDQDGPILRCTRFDALRSLGSRRTRDQVRALDWDGDPTPVLDLLTPFGFAEAAIAE